MFILFISSPGTEKGVGGKWANLCRDDESVAIEEVTNMFSNKEAG